MVVHLRQGADLHMAQLILLAVTVSCCRKSRLVLVLPFWYWITRVVPESCKTLAVVVVVIHYHNMCSYLTRRDNIRLHRTILRSQLIKKRRPVHDYQLGSVFAFSDLILQSWWEEGHLACNKTCRLQLSPKVRFVTSGRRKSREQL